MISGNIVKGNCSRRRGAFGSPGIRQGRSFRLRAKGLMRHLPPEHDDENRNPDAASDYFRAIIPVVPSAILMIEMRPRVFMSST